MDLLWLFSSLKMLIRATVPDFTGKPYLYTDLGNSVFAIKPLTI